MSQLRCLIQVWLSNLEATSYLLLGWHLLRDAIIHSTRVDKRALKSDAQGKDRALEGLQRWSYNIKISNSIAMRCREGQWCLVLRLLDKTGTSRAAVPKDSHHLVKFQPSGQTYEGFGYGLLESHKGSGERIQPVMHRRDAPPRCFLWDGSKRFLDRGSSVYDFGLLREFIYNFLGQD